MTSLETAAVAARIEAAVARGYADGVDRAARILTKAATTEATAAEARAEGE